MNKFATSIGLIVVSAIALMAASQQAVPMKATYENLTPEQTLERAIQRDLAVIANPNNGGKPQDVKFSQANAKKALANDRAALDAYRSAGPKMAIPHLEQAIRDDQYAIQHWGNGGKLAYVLQARQ